VVLPSAERLARRDRIVVAGSTLGLVTVSWLFLVGSDASHGHALHPGASPSGSLFAFGVAFLMWQVMMAAMMLPAAMPWMMLLASTTRRHDGGRSPLLPHSAFVTGYLLVWGVFSAVAAAGQVALQRQTLLAGADLRAGPLLGGALLVIAGVFQLTPLKAACLRHCRTPLGFLLSYWRPGARGALELGLRHGGYCLVCCWALMILSFALGVMNLLWMAALTLVLCVEKIAPGGQIWSRIFGVVLILWGLSLLRGLAT